MTDFNFTASAAADALGFDRRTVKKRIDAANLNPVGKKNGGDLYFLGDIAGAVYAKETTAGGYDVETLGPKQRYEHWQAEKKETEVAQLRGELVPYDLAAAKFGEMAKSFADFFTTLVDDLEQSGHFNIEQLKTLEAKFDEKRQDFADREFS